MKVSYNWLKNYLDFDLSPKEVSDILTDTGLEVEGLQKIEEVKGGLEGLVIGHVESCLKHPDADRLMITQVNVGSETLQIVCGAPNVDQGQKVVVATVGSTLYPENEKSFTIKKTKLRGVESTGMICSEYEIGLGKDHDGILVLDKKAKMGKPASSYFDLKTDYQLEIGLTPNRCDAMGHIGVARDLKAYLNYHENNKLKLKLPSTSVKENDIDPAYTVSIEIEDKDLCPRYIGAVIKEVQIGPSPEWLRKALESIGLEPINNVVDITNFVMYEFGTPLHAFDHKSIGRRICVKKAKKNEKFTTLDGVERTLKGEELMITNGKENLCIAGVFGGKKSGITKESKTVFLESAIFDAKSIRKTSKTHGLQTDASFRFERGVDPGFTMEAMERAISLIEEVAKGKLAMKPSSAEVKNEKPRRIKLNTDVLRTRLGISLKNNEIKKILDSLDFSCELKDDSNMNLMVPAYRRDVERPEDVMEEVLRIYGFNKVAIPKKWHISFPNRKPNQLENMMDSLSHWFVSNGFNEVINNSLSKDYFPDSDKDKAKNEVGILNPLSSELDTMRTSLVYGLLENLKYNQNRQRSSLKLFEFGKTYAKIDAEYVESRKLSFVLTGKKGPELWNHKSEAVDFVDIKGICMGLTKILGLRLKEEEYKNSPYFSKAQKLSLKKKTIFEFGKVSDRLKKTIGVKGDAFIGILHLDEVIDIRGNTQVTFKELPKTFYVKRDFSLILDKDTPYESIERISKECDNKILQGLSLFDVYEGKNLPKNKKSYAISFTFQHENETLKDAQIDKIMERIRVRLNKELGAELRS